MLYTLYYSDNPIGGPNENNQLLVRDFDPELVHALKQRADNRNAESEPREILEQALKGTNRVPLSEALLWCSDT